MSRRLVNDCFLHDRDRMRHDEALSLLRNQVPVVARSEQVSLSASPGRILVGDVIAPRDIPLHSNSAVDGYAFRHEDNRGSALIVSGRIAAGDLEPEPLAPGTAARIFTGAPIPEGADTVAMQEDCETIDRAVLLPDNLKKSANIREAGEDAPAGSLLLKAGTRLEAQHIAALASAGLNKIDVRKKLRVLLLASGNEMLRVEDGLHELQRGEVFDANTPMLAALLSSLPIDLNIGPVLPDDLTIVEQTLRQASRDHDLVITTGGASLGSEDHMTSVLDRLGKRHVWQIAVKPGRPMLFGQFSGSDDKSDCLYFGLPGNPVAAFVCFAVYARQALLQLCGAEWKEPKRFPLPASFTMNKKPDRREFLRGSLSVGSGGTIVDRFPRNGSGLISSLSRSSGLIEIDEETEHIVPGQSVSFIPFSEFI